MRVCARVLAAALMTGAIAGSVAFPALFWQGSEPHRVLVAPPSSLGRTLRMPALTTPAHYEIVHVVHSAARASRTALAAVRIAPHTVAAERPKAAQTGPAPRAPEPVQPAPPAAPSSAPAAAAPPPATSSRELAAQPPAAPEPAVTPPATSEGESDDSGHGHGQGNAYGHDKKDGPDNSTSGDGSGHGHGKANDD